MHIIILTVFTNSNGEGSALNLLGGGDSTRSTHGIPYIFRNFNDLGLIS